VDLCGEPKSESVKAPPPPRRFRPGATPPGAISHWIAKTDDGLRVVDVWESREQFDRYAEEKIGPYTREVGFTEAPETRFYEVHNYLTTEN
jgi:hypothetical protein